MWFVLGPEVSLGFCGCVCVCLGVSVHRLEVSNAFLTVSHGQESVKATASHDLDEPFPLYYSKIFHPSLCTTL